MKPFLLRVKADQPSREINNVHEWAARVLLRASTLTAKHVERWWGDQKPLVDEHETDCPDIVSALRQMVSARLRGISEEQAAAFFTDAVLEQMARAHDYVMGEGNLWDTCDPTANEDDAKWVRARVDSMRATLRAVGLLT